MEQEQPHETFIEIPKIAVIEHLLIRNKETGKIFVNKRASSDRDLRKNDE